MLSVTNWKLCRFLALILALVLVLKNFERSFFTFLRSFWKMNILTMQLSTMDGDIPDLMMLMPACLRKSLVLLATVFFP